MPTAGGVLKWTPQRLIRWAEKTGPATASMVQSILACRVHPQQGFRSCLGIIRLGKSFGEQRLEAACRRALTLGAYSYKSIESILRKGLDRKTVPEQQNLRLSGMYKALTEQMQMPESETLRFEERLGLLAGREMT